MNLLKQTPTAHADSQKNSTGKRAQMEDTEAS